MADPLFDQITSTTLEELRSNVVFDSLFNESAFSKKLRRTMKPLTNRELVLSRLTVMGVDINRAHEVIREMIEAGTLLKPDDLLEDAEVIVEEVWGGHVLQEPFAYDNTNKR